MTEQIALAPSTTIHDLWRELARKLNGILDAHTVCVAAAVSIAAHTNATTVIGLSGLSNTYYDVWICQPKAGSQQSRWPSERASFESLIEQNRPVRQRKHDLPASQLLGSELWRLPRESILAVPILLTNAREQNAQTAIICLIDPDESALLNLGNIGDLGLLISTYLERASLARRSLQQEIEFGVVHDISYSLTASLDLDDIFRQLSDHIRRTLNVEHLSIALTDPATGDLVFANVLMGPLFDNKEPIRMKPGQGIVGWVAEKAEPLVVNDVYKDKRFFSNVDKDSGFQTNSILAVPLMIEQRVIGVIEAINKQTGNFHNSDLQLLEAISAPLSVSIENARLHSDVVAEKRRIETFFASMSEGLLTINSDRIITMVNEAFLTLSRLQEEDVLGKSVDELIVPRTGDFSQFTNSVFSSAQNEYPQHAFDMRVSYTDIIPLLAGGAVIHDDDGNPSEAILTFSDLTQIREFERMRDDFFANIIHELRTPLATILMYARLLRQGRAGDDAQKADRFLGVIERESDRLQTMVRQMLQLAKLETSDFQRSSGPIQLNEIFEQIMPTMADRATEKGLIFSQRIQPDLPLVTGDTESLYMIFKNLVENAIKFTLSGKVQIDAKSTGDHIEVKVRDDGIGMPEEALPLLFRRFYRSQTAVERGIAGTGLGLYMVKETIESLNGSIDVKSVVGKGTTFTVILPAAKE